MNGGYVSEEERNGALKRMKEAETELKKTIKNFDQQLQVIVRSTDVS
jgi:prefoldin subunit 5